MSNWFSHHLLINKSLYFFYMFYILCSLKPCVSETLKKYTFKKHIEKKKHGKNLIAAVLLYKVNRRGLERMVVDGTQWEDGLVRPIKKL